MKNTDKITNLLFYAGVILFFLGFNFSDNPTAGWYLQTMPDLNGKSISDIFFLDSLNGWASTGTNNGPGNINYILKTTNGGDNWLINYNDICFFSRIFFADTIIGYASGGSGGGTAYLYKTTNGGLNWNRLSNTGASEFDDMTVLNKDTLWLVDHDPLTGGVFRTTKGGQSWVQQLSAGTQNPDKIYMYNARIGFICKASSSAYLRKTTDSGNTWFTVVQNDAFIDMYFTDSLNGWRTRGQLDSIKKTTDGGLNWTKLLLPRTGGYFYISAVNNFAFLNKDTLWASGAVAYTAIGPRALLYISTNGGVNWAINYRTPTRSTYTDIFI
jgi:photosystem II stability/assembly factor-like uncharacterized protein